MQCQAISASPLKPLQPLPSSTLLKPNWHNWSDGYTHTHTALMWIGKSSQVKSSQESEVERAGGGEEVLVKCNLNEFTRFTSSVMHSQALIRVYYWEMEMGVCNAAHVWLHGNLRGLGGGGCLASRHRELITSAFLPSTTFFRNFYTLTVKYGIWQWLIVAHTISWGCLMI